MGKKEKTENWTAVGEGVKKNPTRIAIFVWDSF